MKKINIKKYTSVGLKLYYTVFLITLIPNIILANSSGSVGGGGFTKTIGADNFEALIAKLMDVVVQIGLVILVLAIIYSGFLFVTAQGKDEDIKTAKKTLLYTVIGGIVLLGAQAIGDVICNTAQEFDPTLDC